MFTKKIAFVLLVFALALSTIGAGAWNSPGSFDLAGQSKILLANRYGLNAGSIQAVGKAVKVRYPLQGIVIYESKFVDEAGTTYSIATNEAGREVSVSDLDRAEKAIYETRYGKLERDLLLALRNVAPDAMVEVDIWLKIPEASQEIVFERPTVDGSANPQASTVRVDRKQLDAVQPVDETPEAAAWADAETAYGIDQTARTEAIAAPMIAELRGKGFDATSSGMAPMINVTMPVRMVREYARREEVDTIYMGAKLGNEVNIARQVVGASTVNGWGITGNGKKIGVVEYGGMVSSLNPYLSGATRDNLYGCSVASHVTGIAGLIRSTHATYKGIAPGTNLWVGCGKTDAQVQAMANRANTWGAETVSLSWYSGSQHSPSAMDKFFDNVMFSYNDLVTKSAGNRGDGDGWVTPPGLGYNTLAVGSFDDRNTTVMGDDIMASYSSYVDPLSAHNDREKPEVAAPGSNIMSTTTSSPWVGNIGSGTSYAGPMVAGISSLLYQRNSGLTLWPEATKAIIMATAIRNKEGATRLSEKDGAGGVWAVQADYTARNNTAYGRWGGTSYTCARSTNWNIATMYLHSGHKARIVIVWDQNPNYTYYASKPSADLDLQIYSPSNTIVAVSNSWDNTYEIAEFTPSVTGTYKIQVDKVRCDLPPQYIGWAWSQP